MSESSFALDLAADFYNRYPGELVTFSLRFTAPERIDDLTLQFAMPKVLEVESYELPDGVPSTLPSVVEVDQDMIVLIPLREYFTPGKTYDIVARVRIRTFYMDQYLVAEAKLVDSAANALAVKAVQITVHGKGGYLQFLPEIYFSDDFTSRFLMMFESFWKPISQQIDQIDGYFDPNITPTEFVPWLASWMGLSLDPSLPIERMRAILRQAIVFFQCRGTRQALQDYLGTYTGGWVTVEERRAKNFVLGPGSNLGLDIALGKNNQPNTIVITLNVPQSELTRSGYSEDMYQRKIRDIVRTLTPAHTVFDLNCIFVD